MKRGIVCVFVFPLDLIVFKRVKNKNGRKNVVSSRREVTPGKVQLTLNNMVGTVSSPLTRGSFFQQIHTIL